MMDFNDTLARSGSLFAAPITDANVSFEFFPPKTPKMEETLWSSIKKLEVLNPSFVSVTYGAGGSTRERTHNTVKRILDETSLKPAAHLTCVGATRDEVDAVIQDYKDAGVSSIVALRGDPPEGANRYEPHPGGYANAEELVAGIKAIGDFDISVGAYPEIHPDSPNLAADLDNLKRKIDAGANRAITQFFFEPDQYFRFLDHCQSFGIDVPIVPGILPVSNFKTLKNFAGSTGATVPEWLGHLFEGLDDRPDTRALVAATVAGELCRKLYAGGVRDFHFYTLNRADLTFAVCHMLGHRAPASQ
ncbi:MAG: methylenetetrahydrofolate reductase [NAD(P)H] [Kordiimonadaceae bacterium]|nr:methylenetetrahydrofolate reductase [NAD(P)H] [Kordiimonadaceae bacterium]MBO6567113.1 methylenetetrahydrofolate reductase [NAD(P)H] [Kordiimonadaceae bacterium]MBO6963672.1 methylenetetrahydrofolate reductase [NAD(P)H] [Kordiimonadaceae bacterium]